MNGTRVSGNASHVISVVEWLCKSEKIGGEKREIRAQKATGHAEAMKKVCPH